ncbi:MAG TPA: glycosyltransferase family 2 protein, partial [Burkholderiales bacterium]|nr:glycosyltransferase family 2 protein [Burkholderiales bacterium]
MTADSSRPLVSVVVPVYNHAHYVGACLDSVYDQTHRPLQLIVIDDGSKDDSPRVVEEYLRRREGAPGVEVIFRARENRGAHNTINEGLEAARGEFIAILNSDDFYHPGRIEKCLRACEAAQADFSFTYVEAVGDDGAVLPVTHPWRAWYDAACVNEWAAAPSIGFVLFESNIAVSTGNFFFRRSLYEKLGPLRDYVIAHDLDFLLRALQVSEPLLVKEKLYFYRVHGANTIYSQIERTE